MMNSSREQSVWKAMVVGHQAWLIAGLGLLVLIALGLAAWWLPQAHVWGPTAEELEAQQREQKLAWTQSLTRHAMGADRETTVDVLFVTPEYFRLVGGRRDAASYDPEANLVFFLTEENHSGLPASLPTPVLRFLGAEFAPASVDELVDSVHHRTSVVSYPREGILAHLSHVQGTLELVVAPGPKTSATSTVAWSVPLVLPQPVATGGFRVSGAAVLGLFAGMLASMWPCLFQLTAYFIPSLAGLSMAEAGRGGGDGARAAAAGPPRADCALDGAG